MIGVLAWIGLAWAADPGLLLLQEDGADLDPLGEALLLTLTDTPTTLRTFDVTWLHGLGAAEQLGAVRPLLEEPEVLATAWVDPQDPAMVRLVIAFATEGRGVLRVVEEPAGPGAEQALALAARELLTAAVVPVSDPEPTEVQVSRSLPPPTWVAVQAGGGLGLGDVGPPGWGSLGVGVGRGPTRLFSVLADLELRRSPIDEVGVTGVAGALGAELRGGTEPLSGSVGLRLEAGALRVQDSLSTTPAVWLPQIRAGAQVGGRWTRQQTWLGLWLRGSAVVVSGEVRWRSDGEVALSTGPVELQGGLQLGRWL